MWFIWTGGFVSIVEKREDRKRGTLTVRARDRGSLANFLVLARGGDATEIAAALELQLATDYPYREVLHRADVANAWMRVLDTLTYSNFKDAAAAYWGGHTKPFVRFLHAVWTSGLGLETKATRRAVTKALKSRRDTQSNALDIWKELQESAPAAKGLHGMSDDDWVKYDAAQN